MFRRNTGPTENGGSKPNGKIITVLGPGTTYQGALTGEGGVRIDGVFDGKIDIAGPLVIGENGKVTADCIRAASVSVAGAVRGNITATKVEILRTGKIWGDLVTSGFATEDGAYLRGQIRMLEDGSPTDFGATPAFGLPS